MTDYCYSTNEEEFNYTSEWECLERLWDEDYLQEGAVFFRGTSKKGSASDYFIMNRVVEDMQERAWDECGEWAEGFLEDVPEKKWKELDKYICKWLDKNAKVNFYTVENVEKIVVTQEMVDSFKKEHFESMAKCKWNFEADCYNQWDNLSEDEQNELIKREMERESI